MGDPRADHAGRPLRPWAAAIGALLLLIPCGPLAAQGAITFRGRLVHVDGLSTASVTVGFGALGSTVTDDRGRFETALPAGTTELSIEIPEHDWTVLYPRDGRVPVPRDPQVMPEIVVGESVESATLRLFAERHEKLAAELANVGAEQGEILDVLQTFVDRVTSRLDVDAAALEREIELQRQRAQHFPTLSATLSAYLLAARNLNEYFKLYGHAAFTDPDAFAGLRDVAAEYNVAFETLSNEQKAFEYQVATYWESEELRSDLRAVFDYALGEVHDIRILPLNGSLVVMRDALGSRRPDRAAIQQAQATIDRTVQELDLRLPELERRADRVLAYLSRQ